MKQKPLEHYFKNEKKLSDKAMDRIEANEKIKQQLTPESVNAHNSHERIIEEVLKEAGLVYKNAEGDELENINSEKIYKLIDLAISKTRECERSKFKKWLNSEGEDTDVMMSIKKQARATAFEEVFTEQYAWAKKLQTYVEKEVKKLGKQLEKIDFRTDTEHYNEIEMELEKEKARLVLIYASSLEWKKQAEKYGITKEIYKKQKFKR